MRGALIFVALLASSAALASPLSLSGVYGNASTCALYAAAGGAAVSEPDSYPTSDISLTFADATAPDYVLVSESEIVGFEWNCEPRSIEGARVSMDCASEGMEWSATATIHEDVANGLLTFGYEDHAVVTLFRCVNSTSP